MKIHGTIDIKTLFFQVDNGADIYKFILEGHYIGNFVPNYLVDIKREVISEFVDQAADRKSIYFNVY